MRLHLLNADENQGVVVGIFYASPMRLDVFVDGIYVDPKDSEVDPLDRESTAKESFIPDVSVDSPGANFFDRSESMLYVLLKNYHPIDIRTTPVVVLCMMFPPMTVEEFYGLDLVNNLALFLDVPPENIRITRIVMETARRRRRDAAGPVVDLIVAATAPSDLTPEQMQIPEPAGEHPDFNETSVEEESQSSGNQTEVPANQTTQTPGNQITSSQDANATSTGDAAQQAFAESTAVMNTLLELKGAFDQGTQTGQIGEAINSDFEGASQEPTPSALFDENADAVAEAYKKTDDATSAVMQLDFIRKPTTMHLVLQPLLPHEGSSFGSQPSLLFRDQEVRSFSIFYFHPESSGGFVFHDSVCCALNKCQLWSSRPKLKYAVRCRRGQWLFSARQMYR